MLPREERVVGEGTVQVLFDFIALLLGEPRPLAHHAGVVLGVLLLLLGHASDAEPCPHAQ